MIIMTASIIIIIICIIKWHKKNSIKRILWTFRVRVPLFWDCTFKKKRTVSIIIIIICIIKWHKKIPSKEFCGHLGLGYSYFGTVLSKKKKEAKKQRIGKYGINYL